MSGSEGSSTKQSTSRVSQGRLDGASEGGNAWLAVTTADARIPIKNQTGKVPVFFYFVGEKWAAPRLFISPALCYTVSVPLGHFRLFFQAL